MRCFACGAGVPAAASFCPSCGVEQDTGERADPTLAAPEAGITLQREPTAGPGSSATERSARFAAGTLLLGRYRIVSLLGRGGMGEVYRADDLKLDQPVALKFLPESAGRSGDLLDRLLAEVRLARQISHPNVCRVYDVAETGESHFLSMEYIDGEDLGTLLRRIGRLPRDKASQIGRQLCAGLAAAHARGVLHRDIKPSNVMIDGHGNARITDFGLAGLAEAIPAGEVGLGTPAYMAPEQLAGREVSAQSDLYALGLVLYELFTGEKAFRASSAAELARLQESGPATPSSLVEGLEPAVERAVMRCLEEDPAERPTSALAVAAALPGGDPLAAALEAGETPSPELVAQARTGGGLAPWIAWSCLALALAGVVLAVALAAGTQISRMGALPKSAPVLEEKAREITRAFGYTAEPRDTLSGFSYDEGYFDWIAGQGRSNTRWESLEAGRSPAVYFWYRQSPRHLVPYNRLFPPTAVDPPVTVPGMVSLQLDTLGRLVRFEAVPPEYESASEPSPEPDWTVPFAWAELEPEAFGPAEPAWTPPVWTDRRAAWEGEVPAGQVAPIRVESGATRGRPVWFRIVPPWSAPIDLEESPGSRWTGFSRIVSVAGLLLALLGVVLLARRNLRRGRSDLQGAFRLGVCVLCARLLLWVSGGHHVAAYSELSVFFGNLAGALFYFCLLWLSYNAMEPYLRRLWPRMLISWVRLLRGRFRDPLVGQHVLVGCLYGLVALQIWNLGQWVSRWLERAPPRPEGVFLSFPAELQALAGARHALSVLLRILVDQVFLALLAIALLLVLRLLVRRTWLSVVVWIAAFTIGNSPGTGSLLLDHTTGLLVGSLAAAVLFRFGIFPLLVGNTVAMVLKTLPLTLDLSAWYSHTTFLALAVVLGLVAWGFHVSLGGRPLFRDELAQA